MKKNGVVYKIEVFEKGLHQNSFFCRVENHGPFQGAAFGRNLGAH
jgi:hypothetical protein